MTTGSVEENRPRPGGRSTSPAARLASLIAISIFTLCMPALSGAIRAAEPLDIAVMLSSDASRCFEPGVVKSIRKFTGEEAERLNAAAGPDAPSLRLLFFDDFESAGEATANLRVALADRRLLAVVGMASSSRAKAAFAELGDKLRETAVPMLTGLSLAGIYADQPTVFSMTSTVDDELQVVRRFIRDQGFQRPAFIGLADDDYADALGRGLASGPDALTLTMDRRVTMTKYRLDDETSRQVANELKTAAPDLLVLAVQSGPGADVLKALSAAGSELPVLVLYGRGQRILNIAAPVVWNADVYEIARDGVPGLFNERLQQQLWQHRDRSDWVLPDTPVRSAPGWADGTCTEPANARPRQLRDEANKRAIGRGRQYADMVALVGGAISGSDAGEDVAQLRARVMRKLALLSSGKAINRGAWQDWSFTASRASAEDTLITVRPRGKSEFVLAPTQYHRVGDSLQSVPVITLSLDPIAIRNIDTSAQTFEAEFYLSLASRDDGLGIDAIEFTNGARSTTNGAQMVQYRQIHDGGGGTSFPVGVKLYKVAGRFLFNPELSRYPFDSQRLLISFQPVSTARAFLVQPGRRLASGEVPEVEGFHILDGSVGSDQDVIPTLDPDADGTRVVSFYKFNQGWVAKRTTTDFYLRVVVPLVFILLVTWFSVFLNERRFDAAMAIQVTALLSAIALSLALPRVEASETTLYDKIFMLTYAAVAVMIGLTVLHELLHAAHWRRLKLFVSLLQIAAFPVAIGVATWAILVWSHAAA